MTRSLLTRREALRGIAAGCVGVAVQSAYAGLPRKRQAGEIVLRGGRIVNADGIRQADLRIVGETIAEIGPVCALRPPPANRRKGRRVMQGGSTEHAPDTIVVRPNERLNGGTCGGITTVALSRTGQVKQ